MAHGQTRRSALSIALKRCRTSLAIVFVFSFFLNLLSFAFPLYLLQIYDRVLPSRNSDTLVFLTLIVLVAVIALALLDSLRSTILARLAAWIDRSVGGEVLSAQIVHANIRGRPTSSKSMRRLAAIRNFVGGPNVVPLFDAPWTPLFITVLFLMHPYLGWIALTGAVLMLLLGLVNEWQGRRSVTVAADHGGRAADAAMEAARNADVVEAMGMRANVVKRWGKLYLDASEAEYRVGVRAIVMSGAGKMIKLALLVAILATSAYLILTNALSGGTVIAAMLLFRRSVAPMERCIRAWNSFISAREGMRTLEADLAELGASRHASPVFNIKEGLTMRGVQAHVPGQDDPILAHVDLEARPGDALAIVGRTGSGKTTLAQVVIGNLKPSSGEATFGGVEIARVDRDAIGPLVGYLPQTVGLFAGTIRDNIARMTDAPLESVVAAARLARVNRMIRKMPAQYETEVGEAGALLSGGQRQRVGLARALFGEPQLIVLDEPDANLDAEGRRAMSRTIRDLKRRNVIVILITHRAEAFEDIDRVYRLKDGVLSEQAPAEPQANQADSPAGKHSETAVLKLKV